MVQWNVSGTDEPYTGELMLCWGLVQARREYISQRNIKPLYYYSISMNPIMGTKDLRHQSGPTYLIGQVRIDATNYGDS